MRLRTSLATLFLLLAVAVTPGSGAILLIPDTTVAGTDNHSGPSFTVVGNFTAADVVNVQATGTVDLSFGNYTVNAAGVVVAPNKTNINTGPGSMTNAPNGFAYGAVLIGNSTLGFRPLFVGDLASGLGSATVPTTIVSLSRSLGSIFGSGVTIANGTVLSFRINDAGNFADNSGSLRLTTLFPLNVEPPVSAPEPATFGLAILGVAGLAAVTRRSRRD